MTARTAWTAGNGVGLTWTTVINSADMASMTNGQSVLSSVSDIANGTNLDQFMDVSLEWTISSSTIAAGANATFWIFELDEGGSVYGDNSLTAGNAASVTPGLFPAFVMPFRAASSQTSLYGYASAIIIPPGSFRLAVQNNSGFSLSSGTQTVKYRTYNIQLNN